MNRAEAAHLRELRRSKAEFERIRVGSKLAEGKGPKKREAFSRELAHWEAELRGYDDGKDQEIARSLRSHHGVSGGGDEVQRAAERAASSFDAFASLNSLAAEAADALAAARVIFDKLRTKQQALSVEGAEAMKELVAALQKQAKKK